MNVIDQIDDYCTVCFGEEVNKNSTWPTEAYNMGFFFCSEHEHLHHPNATLFHVIPVSYSDQFFLHHDNGVKKSISNNNYFLSEYIPVYAENGQNAVQAVKWVFPGALLYTVMSK